MALHGLARVARAQDQPTVALLRLQDALDRIAQIGRHAELTAGRGRFFEARRDLVDDALQLLLERGLVAQAFAVADASHARVLRAFEAEVRVDRLPAKAKAEWQRRLETYLKARKAFEQAAEQAELLPPAELPGWRAKRTAESKALTRAFDHAYAVLDEHAPEASAEGATVAQVQAALRPGEALLLLTDHQRRPGGFLVTRSAVQVAPLEGDPLAGFSWPAGLQHLFVVAGGQPVGDTLHQQALQRFGVSRLPHAGALLRRPQAPEGPPLVVADPVGNLPNARAEAQQVQAALPQARALLAEQAARDAVLAALDGARTFHFAGHGVLTPDSPWDAHLQLADRQRLTLADVLTARPRVGTVVLSGCETGARLTLGRHDRVGLPEAFLSAGASAVLATHRPIGDGEPAEFLSAFYAAGGAEHPGPAFRKAALSRQAAGDLSWQAFELVGFP